ncbi:hypothetical protein [Streptomyces sp. NPDC056661]|uniref:hypothetical protein n=1 Tax=Streptomyces sp. NPDC056661 TaxID=3345898 RepID=UPI0036CC0753
MTTALFAGREALRNVDVAINAVGRRVRTTGGPAPTTITNVSDAGVWTPTGYKSETDAANAWWRRQSA